MVESYDEDYRATSAVTEPMIAALLDLETENGKIKNDHRHLIAKWTSRLEAALASAPQPACVGMDRERLFSVLQEEIRRNEQESDKTTEWIGRRGTIECESALDAMERVARGCI